MMEFARRVRFYPFVDRVYGSVNDTAVHLWTVLSTDKRDHRGAIYEEEGRMYDEFPQVLFDFLVLCLPSLKKPLKDSVPVGFVRLEVDDEP